MTPDTLAALAHSSWRHGFVIGGATGLLVGATFALFVYAMVIAGARADRIGPQSWD